MGTGQQMAAMALAAALLAACSADTPGNDPVSDPSPAEPPLQNAAAISPWPADYAAMRIAAAGWAKDQQASEADAMASSALDAPPPQSFDLFSCSEPDREPGAVDPRTAELAALAHRIVLMETRLKAAGYSPDVWDEPLITLQTEALKRLQGDVPAWGAPGHDALEEQLNGLLQQAAATMELRRSTIQPEQLPIILEGGCGAFESPFLVRADPPDGRVWVATRFTFQTCQALGKPAWDTSQCRWTEMVSDRPTYLSGTYMVQARWPDGRTLRTSQRFQPDPERGEDEAVPVTVRPG